MESVGDKIKKRVELFGNFLSGIMQPSQNNRGGGNGSLSTQKVYDDTNSKGGNKSDVLEFPIMTRKGAWSDTDQPTNRHTHTHLHEGIPHRFHPPTERPFTFSFGTFFREFDTMFQDMEQSMRMMEQEFGIGNFPKMHELDDYDDDENSDNRYYKFFGRSQIPGSGVIIEELPSNENDSGKSEQERSLRDLMLKSDDKSKSTSPTCGCGDPARHRQNESEDQGLGFQSLWHMLDIFSNPPFVATVPSQTPDHLEGTDSKRHNSFFNFSSESTFSSSSKSPDGTFTLTGKTIRDTPEGREVITRTTDPNGQVQEERQFIPRKDLSSSPSNDLGLLSKIFKPKI